MKVVNLNFTPCFVVAYFKSLCGQSVFFPPSDFVSFPPRSVQCQAGQRHRRKVVREEEEEEDHTFLSVYLFSLLQLLQSQDVKEDAVLCCSMEVGKHLCICPDLIALPLPPLPVHV